MTMTRAKLLGAANAAAQAAYVALDAKPTKKWWQAAAGGRQVKLETAAAFLDTAPDAPAEALYRALAGDEIGARPWGSEPAVQAGVLVFHAVYQRLLALETPPDVAAPPPRGATFERTIGERVPGVFDRDLPRQPGAFEKG